MFKRLKKIFYLFSTNNNNHDYCNKNTTNNNKEDIKNTSYRFRRLINFEKIENKIEESYIPEEIEYNFLNLEWYNYHTKYEFFICDEYNNVSFVVGLKNKYFTIRECDSSYIYDDSGDDDYIDIFSSNSSGYGLHILDYNEEGDYLILYPFYKEELREIDLELEEYLKKKTIMGVMRKIFKRFKNFSAILDIYFSEYAFIEDYKVYNSKYYQMLYNYPVFITNSKLGKKFSLLKGFLKTWKFNLEDYNERKKLNIWGYAGFHYADKLHYRSYFDDFETEYIYKKKRNRTIFWKIYSIFEYYLFFLAGILLYAYRRWSFFYVYYYVYTVSSIFSFFYSMMMGAQFKINNLFILFWFLLKNFFNFLKFLYKYLFMFFLYVSLKKKKKKIKYTIISNFIYITSNKYINEILEIYKIIEINLKNLNLIYIFSQEGFKKKTTYDFKFFANFQLYNFKRFSNLIQKELKNLYSFTILNFYLDFIYLFFRFFNTKILFFDRIYELKKDFFFVNRYNYGILGNYENYISENKMFKDRIYFKIKPGVITIRLTGIDDWIHENYLNLKNKNIEQMENPNAPLTLSDYFFIKSLDGISFFWKFFSNTILSFSAIIAFFLAFSFSKSFYFSQVIFLVTCLFYLVYLLFSGFVYFVKRNKFGKFTSVIQRFWRRSFIIFWMIEFSLFLVFIYLTLNSSSESINMLDVNQYYKVHLFSWRYFLFKNIMNCLILIFITYLLYNGKYMYFNKISRILVTITVLLVYLCWIEFYQFYHIVNYYLDYIWIFDTEDHLWNLEQDIKRTRVFNSYYNLCIILKFWHSFFIVICWLFFFIRSYELERIRYPLLSSNYQNFLIYNIMSWFCMLFWLKYIIKEYMQAPYYWFFLNPIRHSINSIIKDQCLIYKHFLINTFYLVLEYFTTILGVSSFVISHVLKHFN